MRTPNQHTHGRRTFLGVLVAFLIGALAFPQVAMAAPSQSDIDAAKEQEHLAELSVAQLEVYLAQSQANANTAMVAAQQAAEDLNAAQNKLNDATALAEKTQAEADQAQSNFEAGRKELAAVVQNAYRSGTASLDALAPYLTADGLENVEARQNIINKFGSAVDTKLQSVAALQQVAKVMADSAEKAKQEQEAAAAEAAAKEEDARKASDAAQAAQSQAEVQYEAGVEELAARQNTTKDLVRQQQEAIQAEREEAARQALLQQAAEKTAADQRAAEEAASRSDSRSDTGGGGGTSNSGGGSSWQPDPEPDPDPYVPPTGSGASGAISYAQSLLGSPYVWGGEGPGYDCSGLVTVAYRSVGIYLTHQSSSQYYQTSHVSIDSAQPGDLIFWSSNGSGSGIYHVAIYLGGGQIIEAPTFGVPVRITSIYNWGSVLPYAGRVV